MDLSNVTTIRKSSVQKQDFDVRYKYSNGKFQLSDRFYANKGMNTNGLTFHLLEDNGETVPLVSIRPNEESVFYKGKAGDADKATDFAYSLLESSLQDLGFIGEGESGQFVNFSLVPVGEQDGYTFYRVVPREEDTDDSETEEPVASEDRDLTGQDISDQQGVQDEDPTPSEETPEIAEAEEAVEDGEYDPFA